ncbi:MAG: SagB/ThcOx family dehydrogenase [Asgard group archaeon]|nr:SagB/ThcOx family dehydrogenase [Asgard group archaeon]
MILKKVREFLKANDWMDPNSIESDRKKGIPAPDPYKSIPEDGKIIDLPSPKNLGQIPLIETIVNRRSHRKYNTEELISLEELSFLLYATQGLAERKKKGSDTPIYGSRFRNVASGGNKHPFETYLVVYRVTGLTNGLYRYLPVGHKLLIVDEKEIPKEEVIQAYNGRKFIGDAAVVFIWSTIPYRTYHTYGSTTPKIIAQDSGHLCQNLYLACTSIGLGMVAIGAYHQDRMDQLIKVDGTDEFVVYVAPVGKIP